MSKLHWEDFKVGFFGAFGPRLITREEIIAFAREFDPQPMHLDEEAARRTMLGGLAASGWHTCSLLMRMIADGFVLNSASMGAPGVDEVKWLKPVRPGDRLTVRATITETRPSKSRPEAGFVRFVYEMVNQNGEPVLWLETAHMVARRHPANAPASVTPEGATAHGADR